LECYEAARLPQETVNLPSRMEWWIFRNGSNGTFFFGHGWPRAVKHMVVQERRRRRHIERRDKQVL